MAVKILAIPGDGIGPEITKASLAAVTALADRWRLDLTLEEAPCGLRSLAQYGTTLRPEDLQLAKDADGVILGPMSVRDYPPVKEGGINVSAVLRQELDLYANIRPCYTRPGISAAIQDMDLVFVRENLEDFYADRNMSRGIGEFMPTPEVAMAVGKITSAGSRRVARAAFDLARRRTRHSVTVVHKVPVLKMYYGFFLDEVHEVAKEYPDVSVDDLMVDAAAALLIRTPERFDVVLAPNMFGDILSDEAAELTGSLGLGGSLNHGSRHAMAQAAHGSAPDIAGRDIANPCSMLYSIAMLFEHLGEKAGNQAFQMAGLRLRDAVDAQLAKPESRTRDLGGEVGTAAFGDQVAGHLATDATAG
jgi:isocitrate/isopropylmalate dehydrogenase